jgi:Flp pilus assembly protein TadD
LDHYAKAVSLDSTDYEIQDHMGTLLLTQGRVVEAIPHLQVAAAYQPNDTNLASLLKAALMRR